MEFVLAIRLVCKSINKAIMGLSTQQTTVTTIRDYHGNKKRKNEKEDFLR
jgi:hypothetical protein